MHGGLAPALQRIALQRDSPSVRPTTLRAVRARGEPRGEPPNPTSMCGPACPLRRPGTPCTLGSSRCVTGDRCARRVCKIAGVSPGPVAPEPVDPEPVIAWSRSGGGVQSHASRAEEVE